MRRICHAAGLLLLGLLSACNPTVDVYAPEKEIFVVYGVLNPDNSEQYVSVTKAFQVESDALVYAAESDLSVRDLDVRLISDSTVWEGQIVDLPRQGEGLFSNSTGAYRFETSGNMALQQERKYMLEIRKPGNDTFLITAETRIPARPLLKSPGAPIFSPMQGTYTFPTVNFEAEQDILFLMGGGFGFELRIYVEFEDGLGTKEIMWGPTAMFTENRHCPGNNDRGEMCYQIPGKAVPRKLMTLVANLPDSVYFIDTMRVAPQVTGLSESAWMEVTAVDSALSMYIIAGNPFGYGLDLLQDRKLLDNISGENIGILGSYSTHKRYIFLSACTKYLAGITRVAPADCQW
jgi:hypothetical protein